MRVVEISLKLVGDEVIDEPADGLQEGRQVAQRAVQASTVVLGHHRQPGATCRRARHVLLQARVNAQVLLKRRQLCIARRKKKNNIQTLNNAYYDVTRIATYNIRRRQSIRRL